MYDYIELGCSPYNEDCVQVTRDGDYMPAMRAELHRYKDLLEKVLPVPDEIHAHYAVKWFPHDFGSYGEVVIKYNDNDPQAIEFACFVEAHTPATWDDITPRSYTPELTDELLLQE